MEGTQGRRRASVRCARGPLAALVAAALAVGVAPAVAAGAEIEPPAPPDITLPTWQSTYSWSAADGYFGWHRNVLAGDDEAYGLDTALGGRPGLWVWPRGGRRYGPESGAEWVLRAPGTTRIARATVLVSFRDDLFAHHCLRITLRSDSETRDGRLDCKPPHSSSAVEPGFHDYRVQLADPSGQPVSKELSVQISLPICAKRDDRSCSKMIPAKDPLPDGPVVQVKSADLVLVDDDAPVVTPSGPFFDLDGRYIDGRQTYPLHVDSSDAGAGISAIDIEHRGWPGPQPPLARHAVECDPHHQTAGLDARICRAEDSIGLDVDTRLMPEGTRNFLAFSPDVAGNVGERSWSVIIDRTPPTAPQDLRFTTPEEGSAQPVWDPAADPVLPDGTRGSGVASYRERHRVGDGGWSAWKGFDRSTRSGDEVYDQPAGTTVGFEVEALDAVGNVSEVASTSGHVYGSPPSLGLSGRIADMNGDYVGSEQSSLNVTATDDGVGVKRLWLGHGGNDDIGAADAGCTPRALPDGSPWKALCPSSAGHEFSIDTSLLPEGAVTLVAGAIDRAGNQSTDASVTLLVDHTAPAAPSDPEIIDLDTDHHEAEINWDGGDDPDLADGSPGSGTAEWRYRYRLNAGDWTAWSTTEDDSFTIENVNPADSYDIELAAVDAAGNVSNVGAGTIAIPNAPAQQAKWEALPPLPADNVDSEMDITGLDLSGLDNAAAPRSLSALTAPSGSSGTARAVAASVDPGPGHQDQPCGPGNAIGHNVVFGVQTTKTPAVTWGWFIEPQVATAIFGENPLFIVTFTNKTTVNGKTVPGPGPHPRSPFYVYHANIRKLGGRKSNVLHFGDKIHIHNEAFGEDENIRLKGHLDFYCTVKHASLPH
jgi:hypothetical protein